MYKRYKSKDSVLKNNALIIEWYYKIHVKFMAFETLDFETVETSRKAPILSVGLGLRLFFLLNTQYNFFSLMLNGI